MKVYFNSYQSKQNQYKKINFEKSSKLELPYVSALVEAIEDGMGGKFMFNPKGPANSNGEVYHYLPTLDKKVREVVDSLLPAKIKEVYLDASSLSRFEGASPEEQPQVMAEILRDATDGPDEALKQAVSLYEKFISGLKNISKNSIKNS